MNRFYCPNVVLLAACLDAFFFTWLSKVLMKKQHLSEMNDPIVYLLISLTRQISVFLELNNREVDVHYSTAHNVGQTTA